MNFHSVSHVIGYIDLVLTILGLLVGLLFCLGILLGWFPSSEDDKFSPEASVPSLANDFTFYGINRSLILIALLTFGLFMIGVIVIYCSVLLIKGTKKGVLPRDGLTNCLKWRRAHLLLTGALLSNIFRQAAIADWMTQDYVLWLSAFGVRVVDLLIVHLHIKQLEMEVKEGDPIVEDI